MPLFHFVFVTDKFEARVLAAVLLNEAINLFGVIDSLFLKNIKKLIHKSLILNEETMKFAYYCVSVAFFAVLHFVFFLIAFLMAFMKFTKF